VPGRHSWVPTQHPLQVMGPHGSGGGGTHCCPTHDRPELAHDAHACPPEPHIIGSLPLKQTLPEQHPPLQLVALHWPTFVLHACMARSHELKPAATQSLQACPIEPHAPVPPPDWQT